MTRQGDIGILFGVPERGTTEVLPGSSRVRLDYVREAARAVLIAAVQTDTSLRVHVPRHPDLDGTLNSTIVSNDIKRVLVPIDRRAHGHDLASLFPDSVNRVVVLGGGKAEQEWYLHLRAVYSYLIFLPIPETGGLAERLMEDRGLGFVLDRGVGAVLSAFGGQYERMLRKVFELTSLRAAALVG